MDLRKHVQRRHINPTMQKLRQTNTRQLWQRTERPCSARSAKQLCFVQERCCPGNAFHGLKTTLKDFYNIDKRQLLLAEKAAPT